MTWRGGQVLEPDEADQFGVREIIQVIDGGTEDFGFGEFLNTSERLIRSGGGRTGWMDWGRDERQYGNDQSGSSGGQASERSRGKEPPPPVRRRTGKASGPHSVICEVGGRRARRGLV